MYVCMYIYIYMCICLYICIYRSCGASGGASARAAERGRQRPARPAAPRRHNKITCLLCRKYHHTVYYIMFIPRIILVLILIV